MNIHVHSHLLVNWQTVFICCKDVQNSFTLCIQEFAPSDEELLAYRKDEAWDPEKAKQIAQLRVRKFSDLKDIIVLINRCILTNGMTL